MKWYHKYLLHNGWDKTEAMINQCLYWHDTINAAQKEVTECNVCQRTKQSTKNRVNCVDLIGP